MLALLPSAAEAARWPCRKPEVTATSKAAGPWRFQLGIQTSAGRRPFPRGCDPSSVPLELRPRREQVRFLDFRLQASSAGTPCQDVAQLVVSLVAPAGAHTGMVPEAIWSAITQGASHVRIGNRQAKPQAVSKDGPATAGAAAAGAAAAARRAAGRQRGWAPL